MLIHRLGFCLHLIKGIHIILITPYFIKARSTEEQFECWDYATHVSNIALVLVKVDENTIDLVRYSYHFSFDLFHCYFTQTGPIRAL